MAKRKSDETKLQTMLAEEQVLLSKERTILSFMRTGLAFIVLGLVVVNLFTNIPAQVVGWLLVAIGFGEVFESFRRLRKKQREIEKLRKKFKKSI